MRPASVSAIYSARDIGCDSGFSFILSPLTFHLLRKQLFDPTTQ
jgi:hypothetical protein